MKRQRQVLLLCELLRSVCAASTTTGVSVRLARRADIDAIAAINQRTLPENYTRQFYIQHLMRWPQLNFVAEADRSTARALKDGTVSPEDLMLELPGGEHMATPDMSAHGYGVPKRGGGRHFRGGLAGVGRDSSPVESDDDDEAEREVIGYVLGRMEDSLTTEPSRAGHITSLAVMEDFRRLGVAHALMRCLHENMCTHYDAENVSLHVRISNRAATRLYKDILGYKVAKTVSRYYHDGEDAYVMTRPLSSDAQAAEKQQLFGALEQAGGV